MTPHKGCQDCQNWDTCPVKTDPINCDYIQKKLTTIKK